MGRVFTVARSLMVAQVGAIRDRVLSNVCHRANRDDRPHVIRRCRSVLLGAWLPRAMDLGLGPMCMLTVDPSRVIGVCKTAQRHRRKTERRRSNVLMSDPREQPVAQPGERRPLGRGPSFARRTTSFALAFELAATGQRVWRLMKRGGLLDRGARLQAGTANTHFA